jgi:hypothetical protein
MRAISPIVWPKSPDFAHPTFVHKNASPYLFPRFPNMTLWSLGFFLAISIHSLSIQILPSILSIDGQNAFPFPSMSLFDADLLGLVRTAKSTSIPSLGLAKNAITSAFCPHSQLFLMDGENASQAHFLSHFSFFKKFPISFTDPPI